MMNADWKAFLQRSGAEFDGRDEVLSFGNPDAERSVALSGTVFADLSSFGLLTVQGKDAGAFLQGQFTNDVLQLDEAHSQLNGYCSPKGRLLATFRVLRDGDGYLLSMPRALLADVAKRLQTFVMRSAVTLEDVSERLIHIGVSGPTAMAELQNSVSALPAAVDEVSAANGYRVVRIPGPHPRFEVYGAPDSMMKLWDALNVRAAPVGASPWALLDILAGVPVITPETADAFVPQMVNFQLLGGVSFKKGCYTGQEVVARMQYLGKLKRRMYLARVSSATPPAPGDELYSPEDKEQSAGKIVDAQPHPDGGHAVLAVIQIASREGGIVHLGGVEGPLLEFLELTY